MTPSSAPRILVIGGLDPSGGAGITADARAVQACGGFALPVAACLTVQNRHGLLRCSAVDAVLLQEMVRAACADGSVQAVKLGLLPDPVTIELLARELENISATNPAPLVIDPVLSASAGKFTADELVVAAYRSHLLPLAHTLTPNLPELARLAPRGGASELLALGARYVVVKGGHANGELVDDRLWSRDPERDREREPDRERERNRERETEQAPARDLDRDREHVREVVHTHARIRDRRAHGTGCAFASAYATAIARGQSAAEALVYASTFVAACLEQTAASTDGLPVPLAIVRSF